MNRRYKWPLLVICSLFVAAVQAQTLNSHVQYFGYYQSSDSLSVLPNKANVAFIGANNSTRIQQAAQYGMRAIAVIGGGSGIFSNAVGLMPGYKQAWATLAAEMQTGGLQNIAAIYLYDEAFWNASLNCQSSPITCQTPQQVLGTLNTVISLIHSTAGFQSLPIALNYAAPSVNSSMLIPPGANWIGFDCYGSVTNCWGNSLQGFTNIIKSKLYPGQRLFAVPEGFMTSASVPAPTDVANLYTQIEQHMAIVAAEPLYVAVLPFLWDSGTVSADTLGVANLPIIQQLYQTYAQIILNRSNPVVPVYSFYNPATYEHFFDLSYAEGILAGQYSYEGVWFSVFANPFYQSLPLYRCYIPAWRKHFISNYANCEGQVVESLYGYFYPSAGIAGTQPLVRWFNPYVDDFVEIAGLADISALGYYSQGVMGYVP